MSMCEFLPQPSLFGRNGDVRKFEKGEVVCLKNGHFNKGIYEGSALQPGTGKAFTHLITSKNASGKTYPKRHVSANNVGKLKYSISPTAMKKVLENKVGDPYFASIMTTQGYGGKRKTRKNRKHQKKTRKNRRV